MRLTFTFTDTPDISTLSRDEFYITSLEVPDEALHLIGVRERVLAIGDLVASFTRLSLYLTCKELDLKLHPLKLTSIPNTIHWVDRVLILAFRRLARPSSEFLRILVPHEPVIPDHFLFRHFRDKKHQNDIWRNLFLHHPTETDEQTHYVQRIQRLSDQLLVLINSAPMPDPSYHWTYEGFHPWWRDKALISQQSQRRQKRHKERLQRERDETKRLKREEMIKARAEAQPTIDVPQHGAGRRPGARPGVYKGISMRSQLEIRFAAELDERNIRWFYESEAVGDAGYLIDFYLPDLGVWVEVKGTMIAKDRQVLPDVARYLKQTRSHRLMMYMQSKAYVINPSGFREIEAKNFWDELVK
jgi:hypothetical protein